MVIQMDPEIRTHLDRLIDELDPGDVIALELVADDHGLDLDALIEAVEADPRFCTNSTNPARPWIDAENGNGGPYWCPWCEAVITVKGQIATSEGEAYWHTYDHMDKGPYSGDVLEAFEPLPTVEASDNIPDPGSARKEAAEGES